MVVFSFTPFSWGTAALFFLLASVGAILPDMDSDSGVPFHLTFGVLALLASSASAWYAWSRAPGDYQSVVVYALSALFFVWVVLGMLFKKFTCHRGMAHSIPAAFLAGLVLFSLADRLGLSEGEAFLFGLTLSLGYLLHLVLDELYAAVNFQGAHFAPTKALGSALKCFSHHRVINIAVYTCLFVLLLGNGRTVFALAKGFWQMYTGSV